MLSFPGSRFKLSKVKARLIFKDIYTLGKSVIYKLVIPQTAAKDRTKKMDFNTHLLRKPL